MRFTGIVTQGASRIGTAEFIKAFKVASSLDGRTYTVYRTEGERSDHVRMQCHVTLLPPFSARHRLTVRLSAAGVCWKRGQRRHQDQPL